MKSRYYVEIELIFKGRYKQFLTGKIKSFEEHVPCYLNYICYNDEELTDYIRKELEQFCLDCKKSNYFYTPNLYPFKTGDYESRISNLIDITYDIGEKLEIYSTRFIDMKVTDLVKIATLNDLVEIYEEIKDTNFGKSGAFLNSVIDALK